nr:MAG TPA: hypothetical protein [Caudoviricetes sp.]
MNKKIICNYYFFLFTNIICTHHSSKTGFSIYSKNKAIIAIQEV